MKTQLKTTLAALSLVATAALTGHSQTVTDPCPNRVISWNFDNNGTINPTDLAGLSPAVNWVNSWPANQTLALPDNTGTATTLDLNYGSFGGWSVGGHPGLDANGTANRELVNGYLNSGPAAWGPWTTNTWVSLTNVPYALYDVIVYFNSDASGRKSSIEGPNATYHFSTMGSAARSGANALFLPTTETNTTVFPSADFAVWRGLTGSNPRFTTYPKSGNDQWLGICGFQVIESSNAYCIYGPSPAAQIVPVGQPASFNVIAGGQNVKYQWRHAGVPIANATNATYAIAATTLGQDGNYDVVITNSFSSITSAVATLTFYSPKSLEWAGSVDGTWNTTAANWKTNPATASTIFTETDNVLFGTLGLAQPTITLSDVRTPSSITVSNGSYTFGGGSLGGAGTLRLKNNATLILDTPDNRTGATIIDAGSTLQLDNNDTAGSLGSGALTNNGALLFAAAGDEAYGYPIYGSGSITNNSSTGTITLGSDVSANYLVQSGGGSLLLQGANTLSGGLIVTSGQVWARALNCLGSGPTIVAGGELQLIFGINFSGTSLSLAGGTLRGGIGGSPSYAGVVSLATDSQINVDGGSSMTFSNATGISGAAFNLTKGGGGTLVLPGANNTWASLTVSAGTVTINGTSGSGPISVQSGATLRGAGTIAGAVDVQAGATLAPGASIGTMSIGGNLTLAGDLAIEVNRSVSPSNDLASVTGTIVNSGAGVINVANLGPALQAGDKFKLFNKPVTGGAAMTITGGGTAVWSNKLEVDGSIEVVSAPLPRIVTSGVIGSDLVFSGTNGVPSGTYQVLSSTNVAAPIANWTSVASGNFDGSGNFSVTNAINASEPQRYYLLQIP